MRIHPNILKKNREDFERFGGNAMYAYKQVNSDVEQKKELNLAVDVAKLKQDILELETKKQKALEDFNIMLAVKLAEEIGDINRVLARVSE
jgi:hypothetical protein